MKKKANQTTLLYTLKHIRQQSENNTNKTQPQTNKVLTTH